MKKLINKLFLIKEIKSKNGVVHFRRWRLLSTPWFAIYIHGIYKADEDEHLHDHPWDYLSIVLRGCFYEELPKHQERLMTAGSVAKRKAENFHKLETIIQGPVYTLFFTGKRKREWGYDYNGTWIDNVTYRKLKNSGKLNEPKEK